MTRSVVVEPSESASVYRCLFTTPAGSRLCVMVNKCALGDELLKIFAYLEATEQSDG